VIGLGFHAITFNQSGITIYRAGTSSLRISTKRRRLNEVLFYAYKRFSLHDKLLIVLGRKKVDRGLGFHHAPRGTVPKRIEFNFDHGPIVTDDIEGLIFTDMFMGRIECKSTAVQKAGRLAGIIAQCPQYPGSLTWWVDEETGRSVNHHNKIVDGMNVLPGCHTALQAKTTAVATIHEPRIFHNVDINTFRVYDSEAVVREVFKMLDLRYVTKAPEPVGLANAGFITTSLNTGSGVASLLEAIKKVPGGYTTKPELKSGDVIPPGGMDIHITEGPNKGRLGILTEKRGLIRYAITLGTVRDTDRTPLICTKNQFRPIGWRNGYPCYESVTDPTTFRYVVIIRPHVTIEQLAALDARFPPIIVPQRETE